MLDRTLVPPFQPITHVPVVQAQSKTLSNGIHLHWLHASEQPVIRLEYIFKAGNWYENERSISYFTAKMLSEGTDKRSAAEISEYVDQFGSFLEINQGAERINLSIYTLVKHIPRIVTLVEEILTESVFRERELEILKQTTWQNIQVNQQKTSFLAQNRFRELIFGVDHPYGRYTREQDIQAINPDKLIDFYQAAICQRPFDVLISGQITDDVLAQVENHLKGFRIQSLGSIRKKSELDFGGTAEIMEKVGSVQSSIRFGKRMLQPNGEPFTRRSKDYFDVSVLNEILGGYFGSRLMKNIREDKGFTYGIHSSLVTFPYEGFMVIGTDVKREYTQQTLDEIRKEIRILQTEPVPADELETVKNYMLGSFAGSVTTPFSLADHFKTIYFDGLDYAFYDQYVSAIQQVTPESILALANEYMNLDQMTEVVAGGK